MDKSQLDEIMQDLEAAGTPDLAGVKARVFSFDDIPLLTQKARVLIFDGLSTELVTMALRGAPADLTETVLSSIGARSRRMIEAELAQGSEGIALADIMEARKSISSSTVRLSREGAFDLPGAQTAEAA
jgi:flagellar motor switch protein FliG